MNALFRLYCFLAFTLGCLGASAAAPTSSSQSLAGTWRFQLDPHDEGLAAGWAQRTLRERIQLPGTLTAPLGGWPGDGKL